jgi:TPR repeat protein
MLYQEEDFPLKNKKKSCELILNSLNDTTYDSKTRRSIGYSYVGDCYLGNGFEKDYEKSVKFYSQSVNLGLDEALLMISRVYFLDKKFNLSFDFLLEYTENSNDLKSLYDLGFYYENGFFFIFLIIIKGIGTEKNEKKGIFFYYIKLI